MRLGVLALGSALDEADEGLLEASQHADVDIVSGEATGTSSLTASKQGMLVARADCDGVLLLAKEQTAAPFAADAARSLNCPILLVGAFDTAFLNAAGSLAEAGLPFDRHVRGGNDGQAVLAWLSANQKSIRHRGIEAAKKLLGQRFALFGSPPEGVSFDAAQWRSQLGVTVLSFDSRSLPEGGDQGLTAFCREAGVDFGALGAGVEADNVNLPFICATNGDVNGALTMQLLHLVAGGGIADVKTLRVGHGICSMQNDGEAAPVTFARITRRAGRFRCHLFSGNQMPDGPAITQVAAERLAATLTAGKLHLVPGDHVSVMRAACGTLGVETVVLE